MVQQRRGGRRRKIGFIAANRIDYIDYKGVDLLRRFTSKRGEILSRCVTGTSTKSRRKLTVAIKRACVMGLLPFVAGD